jgi:hypothetical protein
VESRAKVLGQPLNPVLMLLPLGILTTAAIADLGAILSGLRLFATIAHADTVTGLIVGLVALCALLIDLLTARAGTPARAGLTVVCTAFGAAIALFAVIFSVESDPNPGNVGLFLCELLALASGFSGVWLARGLSLGRPLPNWLLAAEPSRHESVATAAARRAIARRWVPATNSDDPESTVAIFGLATGRAPVRSSSPMARSN